MSGTMWVATCCCFLILTLQNSEILGENFYSQLEKLYPNAIPNDTDGNYDALVELHTQLCDYYETKFGAEDPKTIEMLLQLKKVYLDHGKYHKALEIALKIYVRQQKILGTENKDTLHTAVELGNIYYILKNYEMAELFLKKAYGPTKAHFGQNHLQTMVILFLLANVYQHSGHGDPKKLDLAFRYYRKVHHVLSTNPRIDKEQEYILLTLQHIGEILILQQQFMEAAEIFENLLEIKSRKLGEDHQLTQEITMLLLDALIATGETEKADQVLRTKYLEHIHHEAYLFQIVMRKAAALADKGDHAKAREIVEKHEERDKMKLKRFLQFLQNSDADETGKSEL